jgi:type VI secretion system secreted protein Hcp
MAVNAYLVIDGTPGPSTSKTDAIDVLSFSFGASMTNTYGAGSSGKEARAGRADISDLTIMKVLDKTSPALFDHCVTGNVLSKVTLLYDKPVGDSQQDYFKVEMTDALITSIQLSGSSENPTESVAFAFQKVVIAYNPEGDDGSLVGFIPKGFDMGTLKPF